MNLIRKILKSISSHYDKLIAFVISAVLVSSLVYLAVQLGMIKSKETSFKREMTELVPKKEHSEKVDTAPFDKAHDMIFNPFVITNSVWTNQPMFRIENRFWCYACEKPVPWNAETCPFCGHKQEKDPEEDPEGDQDGDGLTYAVEITHRMGPYDPTDAHMDFDEDGFTNYEEITADPPTDIRNPNSTPPIEQKLKINAIGVNPFKLRYKSKIKLPTGQYSFGLNLQQRGMRSPRTYFKKLGDEVEGFELINYEEKIVEDPNSGKKDLSELTLKRGEREIVLVKDEDIQHNEFLARFVFRPDSLVFIKSPGQTFELRSRTYKVISVDMTRQIVLIMRLSDGKEFEIHTLREGAENSDKGK